MGGLSGRRKIANLWKRFSLQPVLPQPQPDSTPVASPSLANLPGAPVVLGPLLVAAPPLPVPVHRAHYDLRHTFTGPVSVESASGETFRVGNAPNVAQPSVPAATSPVVRPCPGRIRHFKI